MRARWVWIAIVAGVAATVAVILNEPTFPAIQGFPDGVMNSDTLWPASFFFDIATRADGWRGHSLSRLPSLAPDLAVWGALVLVTRSVRWSVLLYAMLQIGGFVAVGGWLAARLAGRAWVVGASAVFAVTALLGGVALAHLGGRIMLSGAMLPIIHFGPMLLALLAASLAACRDTAARSAALAIGGVSAAVFLSDQLLLIEFVLPLLFASLVLYAAGRMRPSRVLAHAVAIGAGLLIGWLAFVALGRAGVRFDHTPDITRELIFGSIARFRADLPSLLTDAPVYTALVALAAAAFAGLGWWLTRATRATGREERLFLWLFAAATIASDLVFAACFYDNAQSLRYWVAVWAWGVIALSAGLLRAPGATSAAAPLAAAAAATAVFGYAAVDRGAVRLLRWDFDVAACVRSLRGPLGLHAGLAQYWVARPAEVALRWSTQIDQITQIGLAYPWNSDVTWFYRSLADPRRPPDYDFIVMRNVDPDAIVARFGQPDLIASCADTPFWIYRNPAALYPRIAATLPPPPAPRRP